MKFKSTASIEVKKSITITVMAMLPNLAMSYLAMPARAQSGPTAGSTNPDVALQAIAPHTAQEDNRPAASPASQNSALQGGILLEEAAANASNNPLSSSAAAGEQNLAGQQPALDPSAFPRRTLFGFNSKPWTSEQYRKLEYGVLGIVAQKNVFSRFYTITEVLPGCPAALAGLQKGDVEISANGHVFTAQDDQRSYWRTVAGRAGTPVDIVVRRNGELLNFRLVRMNIEDIENDRVRRLFERMLSSLGPPTN